MEFEDELLYLCLKSPNSGKIKAIAEQLKFDQSYVFAKNRNDLQGF